METFLKSKFIMLCGLPGAGKTTLAKGLIDKDTIWISSDKIREELYGSESEQGNPNEVFDLMKKRTIAGLIDNKTVIYDACNISSKKRMNLLNELKKYDCWKQCFICATPYEKCVERDHNRNRVAGAHVIKRMYMNWNTPYLYEGWDEIRIHYSQDAKNSAGKIDDFIMRVQDFDQETPYHLETLGNHLTKAGEYIVNAGAYDVCSNLTYAAYIHDCGKPYTKGFFDSKGNACEVAHYYNHQNTGAYDALFFDFPDKTELDILEISCLIGLHMNPFDWKEEKTAEKYKRMWGEDIFSKIMLLHEADEKASVTSA